MVDLLCSFGKFKRYIIRPLSVCLLFLLCDVLIDDEESLFRENKIAAGRLSRLFSAFSESCTDG